MDKTTAPDAEQTRDEDRPQQQAGQPVPPRQAGDAEKPAQMQSTQFTDWASI